MLFLVPFGLVLEKISLLQTAIAQPPYLPVFDPDEGLRGDQGGLRPRSHWIISGCEVFPTAFISLSYLRSLVVAGISTAILLLIGYPIAYDMAGAGRHDAGKAWR